MIRKMSAALSVTVWEHCNQLLESLVMTSTMQFNKAIRGVSGKYWIKTTTGVHQVYCDMKLECGGHKGGWMRIAA